MEKSTSHSDRFVVRGEDLREAIRQRAEQIYIESGRIPGRDNENWAQAERELRSQRASFIAPGKNAVVVKVDGVGFIGEFDKEASGGYIPGEFKAGGAVSVRFEGDRMFIRRPNGKELATRVVKRVG
jgi:Protein of unknown function (DUF2934)